MNDPHVKKLEYSILAPKSVDYKKAKPFETETEDFRVVVNEEVVTFEMEKHFATPEEARSFVEPFIRSWEVAAGLEGHDGFGLKYRRAETMDRAPPESDKTISLRGEIAAHVTVDGILSVSRGDYPRPAADFRVSPDVESMFIRYELYRKGKEPLLSMAGFCLTVLERSVVAGTKDSGLRRKAAKRYRISYDVLSKLGEITSTRGGESEARKAPKGAFQPLTLEQREWLLAVMRAMIRRAAVWAYNPNAPLPEIAMNDLPPI